MQDFYCSNRKVNGRWTKEEHLRFLQGLRVHGKNWKKIEQLIQTRSGSQIRSHAQKFFLKMQQSAQGEFDSQAFEEDLVEEGEEPTLISKSVSEQSSRHEDVSFYLSRIMDHYEGKQCLDFWASLVDSKDATENSNEVNKSNSFMKMQSGCTGLVVTKELGSSSH